jgi:hypothetical protein
MRSVLPYLVGVAMAATVAVLFAGVISFAFGDRTRRGLATKLMIARVAVQGLAVVLFALLIFLSIE